MALTRAMKTSGRQVGNPNITVRSLQHFHPSVELQASQNTVLVSKQLGHSSVSIASDIWRTRYRDDTVWLPRCLQI